MLALHEGEPRLTTSAPAPTDLDLCASNGRLVSGGFVHGRCEARTESGQGTDCTYPVQRRLSGTAATAPAADTGTVELDPDGCPTPLVPNRRTMLEIDNHDDLVAVDQNTLVLSEQGGVFERDGAAFAEVGTDRTCAATDISLPVTVLHVPGRDLAREIQAATWDEVGTYHDRTNAPTIADAVRRDNPYRTDTP